MHAAIITPEEEDLLLNKGVMGIYASKPLVQAVLFYVGKPFCTEEDCEFCQWRLLHPIELGWEKLWDANCDLTANFALSTQQTADFLVDKDFDMFNDFPDIDATVEKVLSEAKAAGPVFAHTLSAPVSTNPPLPTNWVLSTQQIADFVVHTDFDDFPDINVTVEKLLVEAEVAGPVSLRGPVPLRA